MGFLKKIFFEADSPENIEASPKGGPVSSDYPEEVSRVTLQATLEDVKSTPSSVNLMSRFFRAQKSLSEPPEALHENEAWAPETEFIGLFRKRRGI